MLGEVVGDDRQAEEHVLHDLVHRALVRPVVLRVGVDAEVGRGQDAAEVVVAHPAGEGAQLGHADLLGVGLDARLVGAAPDQHAVDVVAAELVPQQLQRPDQMVHPVLLADLTEVDDQVALALAPGRVRWVDGQALEVGAGAHHVDVASAIPPRSIAIRRWLSLVVIHKVGRLERLALQEPQPGQGQPAGGAELGSRLEGESPVR